MTLFIVIFFQGKVKKIVDFATRVSYNINDTYVAICIEDITYE